MVINVVSTHRFHLLDLARELSTLGHDVHYYSYVLKHRCAQFGLEPSINTCFLWLVWPFFILEKLSRGSIKHKVVWYRNRLIDWYISHTMRRCDVLIVMGYVYHDCMLVAKRKWGSLTILEWGSKHIVEQLKHIDGVADYLPCQLQQDIQKYEVCDYVSVPANHALQSFIMQGVPASKVLVNPYGVDLSQFYPTSCSNEFDLIFVGGWRYEKGCDLIESLCQQYGYRFLHVGALVNMPFPDVENMTHVDSVDQKTLVHYYSKSKVFILPSRAEGLALVQAQAVACGLPIVCSKETGGIDLRAELTDKRMIVEMEELSVECLRQCVEKALALAALQQGTRNYAAADMQNFSWTAYGIRYNGMLLDIVNQ